MTVKELISRLEILDQDKHIYLEMGGEAGRFSIEPINESCDDDTPIGYMIVGNDMPTFNSFDQIKKYLPKTRAAFEMQVETVSLEITDIAKQVSSALGEVSIDELKDTIIREFTKRLREPMEIK